MTTLQPWLRSRSDSSESSPDVISSLNPPIDVNVSVLIKMQLPSKSGCIRGWFGFSRSHKRSIQLALGFVLQGPPYTRLLSSYSNLTPREIHPWSTVQSPSMKINTSE